MVTDFDSAFDRLLENEGGYSDDPADNGGKTRFGVTEKVARNWGYKGDMKELPLETAKQIARNLYWSPNGCDQLPPAIAFHVFDTAYNGGAAIQWLQKAAGVTADGIIGSKTVAAVRQSNPAVLVMAFNALRLAYLSNLKSWPDFSRGWTRRIIRNMEIY